MAIEYCVNPIISSAARKFFPEEAEKLIDRTQAVWDSGESFLTTGTIDDLYSKQRESDSSEELNAAAECLQTQLAQLAIAGAMKSISKNTVAAMCNALDSIDPFSSVTLFGVKIPVRDLADRWNKAHPGDEFYMEPAFEN